MNITTAIRTIYTTQCEVGEWMSITEVASHMDIMPADMAKAIIELARTDEDFILAPESNQRMLTEMDHLYAVRFGGQDKHAIRWER